MRLPPRFLPLPMSALRDEVFVFDIYAMPRYYYDILSRYDFRYACAERRWWCGDERARMRAPSSSEKRRPRPRHAAILWYTLMIWFFSIWGAIYMSHAIIYAIHIYYYIWYTIIAGDIFRHYFLRKRRYYYTYFSWSGALRYMIRFFSKRYIDDIIMPLHTMPPILSDMRYVASCQTPFTRYDDFLLLHICFCRHAAAKMLYYYERAFLSPRQRAADIFIYSLSAFYDAIYILLSAIYCRLIIIRREMPKEEERFHLLIEDICLCADMIWYIWCCVRFFARWRRHIFITLRREAYAKRRGAACAEQEQRAFWGDICFFFATKTLSDPRRRYAIIFVFSRGDIARRGFSFSYTLSLLIISFSSDDIIRCCYYCFHL